MTLFSPMGRHRKPEAAEFAAYLRGTRKPAAEPMPPRPPEYGPPALQQPEWWGGRGPRGIDGDPCGSGPVQPDGSDEDGEAA